MEGKIRKLPSAAQEMSFLRSTTPAPDQNLPPGQLGLVKVMFAVEGGLTLLVPSTCALAALTVPVMAPLTDLAG